MFQASRKGHQEEATAQSGDSQHQLPLAVHSFRCGRDYSHSCHQRYQCTIIADQSHISKSSFKHIHHHLATTFYICYVPQIQRPHCVSPASLRKPSGHRPCPRPGYRSHAPAPRCRPRRRPGTGARLGGCLSKPVLGSCLESFCAKTEGWIKKN